ncbi:MAG TPA: kinase [Rhodanobacteraceae bacterium]|jgi:D-glycerate 3-kinase|nr:kinase [Rhodanobacteraceae bacterium]
MRLDASTRRGYDRSTIDAALDALAPCLRRRRRATIAGISGLQGSGKSTFAQQLAQAAVARGWPSIVLALDDFYLGRRERAKLARDVHPLLATRGVPGTHDPALLERALDAVLRAAPSRSASLPRFDKGRDTRVAPSRWRRVTRAPRLILLEGWCVGVPAQDARALARPLNALERIDDADGRWRTHVNAELAGAYARLWRRLDALIVLAAPDFAIVERWRGEPERELRRRGAPRAMSPHELKRFLMHYERLSRHALRTLPALADIVVALDASRNVVRIRARRR